MHKYAVLVSGRGSNLEAIINSVKKGIVPSMPSMVLTDNSSAKALEFAKKAGIETCFVDPKLHKGKKRMGDEIVRLLKAKGIDTICLAGFMRIIGKNVVEAFPRRIINIHPSLLPMFPGLEAQRQALDAGAAVSGCTVHFVDEGIDTGTIIEQSRVDVLKNDTVETLSARILEREHAVYPRVLASLLNGSLLS